MKDKTVEEWFEDIDAGLEYRRKFAREGAWYKLEQDFCNDPEGDTAIGPNLIQSMGDSLISSLVVPDPEVIIKAERSFGINKAPILESLDNYLMRKLKLKSCMDLGLIRGYLYGKTIFKIGYDSEFGWSPYYDIGETNNMMGMSLTQFDKKGRRIESPDTEPGMPWVRPVLPHDFVVPWGTIYLEDAPWAAHRVVRHIDDIQADVKYSNKARLQGNMTMEDFVNSYLQTGEERKSARYNLAGIAKYSIKAEYVELWEIRDRRTNEILVITRDHDKFLRRSIDAIQIACGMPFTSCSLITHPRSFWSVPPAYYLGQIQKTQFDIAKQSEKQRRINTVKFVYRKDAIAKDTLDKLLSGDVGIAAAVDSSFPLQDVIVPIQTGNMFDSIAAAEHTRRDAREAIGFSRNQLGEFDQSSRRTARESEIVQQGAERRSSRKFIEISDLYIDTIKKVNSLVFEYWQTPRELSVDDKWLYTTGAELKGEYSYDVTIATKRNISRSERKLEAMMMMSQLAQVPGIDAGALFKYVTDAVGDPAFAEILSPSGNQQAQQEQQMPQQAQQAAQGAL
jgi:hypothetical protein